MIVAIREKHLMWFREWSERPSGCRLLAGVAANPCNWNVTVVDDGPSGEPMELSGPRGEAYGSSAYRFPSRRARW